MVNFVSMGLSFVLWKYFLVRLFQTIQVDQVGVLLVLRNGFIKQHKTTWNRYLIEQESNHSLQVYIAIEFPQEVG